MYSPRIVTTSWDDGDPRDIRIAELLCSRGLPGTFYVPIDPYKGTELLASSDLRALCSQGFEVGAHSVSHKNLSALGPQELGHEVTDCKHTLEQSLGRAVSMFCYPNGRYNAAVIREVQKAGYRGARTTEMLSMARDFQPFEMATTVQAYPHSRLVYVRNLGRAKSISGLIRYFTELTQLKSWVEIGKQLFDDVLENGGIWHLYGHSWEIAELGIWSDLKELLDHVCHRDGVTYINNGQLLQ